MMGRLSCFLMALVLLWEPVPVQAKVPIHSFTASGANLTTSASCNNTLYFNCYDLTISKMDALNITTGNGWSSVYQSTTPRETVWYSPVSLYIQVGNTCCTQTVSTVRAALAGSSSFTHSYLKLETCVSACTTPTAFTVAPSGPASGTTGTLIYSNILEGTASPPLNVGILLPVGNGATNAGFGSTGSTNDSAQLTIEAVDTSGKSGDILINVNIQEVSTAILATYSFGAGTTTDYLLDFGSVNGLGLGAAANTTAPFPNAVSPTGIAYYSSYTFTPQFTQFTNTSGTLKAYVSSNFAPTATAGSSLALCDATSNLGTCTLLGNSLATANTLSSAMSEDVTITRYMGLVVYEANGVNAFPGSAGGTATSATVTFVFSVP